MTKDEIRAAILAEAKSWIGTKFHHEGRVKGSGVDCGMLLLEVFEKVGLAPHIKPEHYPPDFMSHRSEEWYVATIMQYADEITEPPYLPGDVFVVKHGRLYSHGGIVVDYPRVIHANAMEKMVTYNSLLDPVFRDRKPRFFRHRSLA